MEADALELVEAPPNKGAERNALGVLELGVRGATPRRKSAIRRFDALSRSERPPSALGGA
jgi:hypothetical protein